MNGQASDFLKLRTSLLSACALLLLGAGVLYFSSSAHQSAKLARTKAQQDKNAATEKLVRVRSEENKIRQESALFQKLQTRGVIREEQRLEWVELLKEIRKTHQLLDLQYTVAPQRALDPPAPAEHELAFYASTMDLHLELLHEEDLTRFLADLRRKAKALILLKYCNITRLPVVAESENSETEPRSVLPAKLEADCQIDWVSVRDPKMGKGSR